MPKAEPERRPLVEVDPVLADYASALRKVETPALDRAEATWAAVEAETHRPSRLWIPALLVAAAAILGFVFVWPSSVLEREQAGRPKQTPYGSDAPATEGQAKAKPLRSTPEPEHVPESTPESTREPRVEVTPEPAAITAVRTETRRPKPAKPTPDSAPSSLAQETSLLREIQRAQAASEHTRVLSLTREHERRFPKGTFAAERTLARVRSLCRLGRTEDAHAASQSFVRRHPRSHLLPQFESACSP